MKKKILWTTIIFAVGLSVGYRISAGEEEKSLRFMFRLFSDVLSEIEKNYIVEKEPSELVEKGIEGMVSSLDPYSEFLEPEEVKEWDIRTKGEFGGLGIQISIRDNWITIIAPIEGTPAERAGLMAGDKIIKINDESTAGWKLNQAVNVLRGKPGTEVSIVIKRPGLPDPIPFTITRDIIRIKAIAYAALIDKDIGYIRFVSFSRNSSNELKNSIDSLIRSGAKKLVLDLRSNPGGLLNEAVRVSDFFLPKGYMIVSTKGRKDSDAKRLYAQKEPLFGEEYPLVVLVDRGSASASEIVSGALQDWDRALIIGDTTFGKGSVQRIFKLERNYEVKLTTAKYYTPSGRSIHRDHTTTAESELEFHSRRYNRLLKGGGGVIPDVVMAGELVKPLVSKLFSRGIFFSYAVEYATKHKDISNLEEIVISEQMLAEFKTFVKEKEIEFSELEFEDAKNQIVSYLKREIAGKYFGKEARYKTSLIEDPVVKRALEYLKRAESMDKLYEIAGVFEK